MPRILGEGPERGADWHLKAEDGRPRIWTGRDGQPRASFEVVAHNVEFGDRGGSQEAQESGKGEGDDEIPF